MYVVSSKLSKATFQIIVNEILISYFLLLENILELKWLQITCESSVWILIRGGIFFSWYYWLYKNVVLQTMKHDDIYFLKACSSKSFRYCCTLYSP